MAGIDSSRAPVGVRERFAMTASAASEAAARACREFGAKGCVLLSTCNRTELWLSGRASLEPYELLCALRGAEPGAHRDCFVRREGLEAAEHLFQLACGMKSQVFGEDQILTQVGTALSLAREAGAADAVLETLFRSAVTSAKKVKTAVRLTEADQSVAVRMEAFLKGVMGPLAGTPCLVIGNGEMGRLAARRLVEAGCRVSMTVRRYRHGEVSLPDGVEAVSYEERLSLLPRVRLVVSATASPHYTLRAAEVGPALSGPKVFCDLAVPRDIDPAIASLPGARVYDTDGICGVADARRDEAALMRAREILADGLAEFARWYGFRAVVPAARETGELVARDFMGRVEKTVRGLGLSGEAEEELLGRLRASAEKTVDRLLFGLRETLPSELWQPCMDALHLAAGGRAEPAGPGDFAPRPAAGGAENAPRFPLFVDLTTSKIALVGGGRVAARRAKALAPFGCSLTVIAPDISPEIEALGARIVRRAFRAGDCAGFDLVLAATDDRETNHAVGEEARRLGVPANVCDAPGECGFFFPAVVRRDALVVGVTASGTNHALAKAAADSLRARMEEWIPKEVTADAAT